MKTPKGTETVIAASYHDTVNVLQGTRTNHSGPFDRSEWFDLLAHAGQQPYIALATNNDDTAVLALTRANGRIEPLRNWYSFTWRQLAPESSRGQKLLTAIARDLKRQTHRVTLWPMPDEDGSATRLEQAFRDAGWSVTRTQCDYNHILEVGGRTFAQYWATRPGKMRTTLKRKAKKVAIEILDRFDPEAWREYEHIYAESWKPSEGDPDLLRRFAEQEGSAGRIRLGIARHEGRAVAAQFWTVENGVAYIHKLAHLESMKALSAGTTLSAALFEQAIDRDNVDWIDFGTGNDPYKADWMEAVRPRFMLDCLDLKQPSAWPVWVKQYIRKLAPGSTRG